MDIEGLKTFLDKKLTQQLIPSRILLDKFRIIEESSRRTSAYTDPKYAPFFYYLGTQLSPENVLEVGFKLGLLSGSFFKGCKTAKHFLGFQEKTEEYYSARLGRANIKSVFKGGFDFYYGRMLDDEFLEKLKERPWDLVLLDDQMDYDYYRFCLDTVWEHMRSDGLIVMDYIRSDEPAEKAFSDFAKIKHREPMVFDTRYGTGLIQK